MPVSINYGYSEIIKLCEYGQYLTNDIVNILILMSFFINYFLKHKLIRFIALYRGVKSHILYVGMVESQVFSRKGIVFSQLKVGLIYAEDCQSINEAQLVFLSILKCFITVEDTYVSSVEYKN
ncbi:hypothetical protein AFI02nite_41520 [Aliivibrio fischeri]|uniref:Uncharacterized protein n=1 Tax=Aliivibrio fischeri TaxID=668 RepID=A0A510UNS2_ALIFS|nr:hypothetical protein AFI02nite_41520 [Aliivibrio fischeri]